MLPTERRRERRVARALVSTGYSRAPNVLGTYIAGLSFPASLSCRRSIRCGPRSCTARVSPRRRRATLRPPSIDCATSFGFVPSADQRSIDVSREARSLSKSVLGKSFSVGRERSGGMDRRSGGLSGIVTTPANACVAGAVCQRGGYYESSGGLGLYRKIPRRPRQL